MFGRSVLHQKPKIAMNAETIREYLRRKPFEPFVIRMSNGEIHEIRHPECPADEDEDGRLLPR